MRFHVVPILLVLNAVLLSSVLVVVKYREEDDLWSLARFGYQLRLSDDGENQEIEPGTGGLRLDDVDSQNMEQVREFEQVQELEQAQDFEQVTGSKVNTCQVCRNQTLCEEIGEHNIIRSIAYAGTGRRIRRFLDKVRRGERFTVAVVGGSVSAGHGLNTHHDEDHDTNMHKRIFNYFVSLSPRREKDHVFVNGAQAGQGTAYFSYCFGEHIPEEPDLILLELGVNDEEYVPWKAIYEALLRGLLSMPSRPAVLNLQLFALLFVTMRTGGDLHLPIASQYDVPTISLQYPVVNKIIKNSKEGPEAWFHPEPTWPGGVDLRHASFGTLDGR